MEKLNIYESMARRSQGDLYIGVVGPARVGKSSFIKRFMDLAVVPNVPDPYERARLVDEMPQSGAGRTITTTEPKFVPARAVTLDLPGNVTCRVRLVDCVGYLVPDALGSTEEGRARMVATPWDEKEIPFEEAAELGTCKVIQDHSTVAVMITTDGSTTQIPRDNYREAEERVIRQLQQQGKPFVVVVNSREPEGAAAQELAEGLSRRFGVAAIAADCVRMTAGQLEEIMLMLLARFPVARIDFGVPEFVEGLEMGHWLKGALVEAAGGWAGVVENCGDVEGTLGKLVDGQIITGAEVKEMDMATGRAVVELTLAPDLYYRVVSEMLQREITGEAHFFGVLRELAASCRSFEKVRAALEQVEAAEYGIVGPEPAEMEISEPEIFQQGSKYGIRLTAKAPSLHIIRTAVSTELAPVVGTRQQAEDLLERLLQESEKGEGGIWNTNIFGKTVYEMTSEQMERKLTGIPENIREKLRRSLEKICDEGKEYFICIII